MILSAGSITVPLKPVSTSASSGPSTKPGASIQIEGRPVASKWQGVKGNQPIVNALLADGADQIRETGVELRGLSDRLGESR